MKNKIKNPVGHPPKFIDPISLQKHIDLFFEKPNAEWTITGLALHLDTSRKVLCEVAEGKKYYEDKPELSNIIKRAKQKVENDYEQDCKKHGRAGSIFVLKNFGWVDRQEFEHGGQVGVDIGDLLKRISTPKN